MKKNKMMRLASVLLVLTLLSTSVISGTFAKYTTQDSASDKARVAKWGVALQVVGNLFDDTYKNTIDGTEAITVQSTEVVYGYTADVVAPGTKNEEGFTFSLNGQPEVYGEVTATIAYENIYLNKNVYGVMVKIADKVVTEENFTEFAEGSMDDEDNEIPDHGLFVKTDDGYKKATTFSEGETDGFYTLEDYVNVSDIYFPVEYKMEGPTTNFNTDFNEPLNVHNMAKLVESIGSKFGSEDVDKTSRVAGKVTQTYSGTVFTPNQKLSDVIKLEDQKITWKWDFCQDNTNCGNGNEACDYCKADTILGLLQTNDKEALKGEVVKYNADNGCYVAPVAAAGALENDYNLETEFSIDITVTQVD